MLAELPVNERDVLLLVSWEQLDVGEAAVALGVELVLASIKPADIEPYRLVTPRPRSASHSSPAHSTTQRRTTWP
jgi:hypothetical protein